jgi:hypothetical protein
MKKALQVIAGLALLITVIAPLMRFGGMLSDAVFKNVLLAATVVWFAAATRLSRPAPNAGSQE